MQKMKGGKIMRIGCVIMASGMARRFGSNKLLHDFHGEPMMVRILRSTAACDFTQRLVVTRHPEVEAICRTEAVPCLLHDLPKRSDTVRLGVEQLLNWDPDLEGILFAASDQPCLTAASIQNLCQTFQDDPSFIYRLCWQDTMGNPVIFPRATFDALLHLPEGKGGGVILKAHPELVRTVSALEERELIDCDTPEILQSLL